MTTEKNLKINNSVKRRIISKPLFLWHNILLVLSVSIGLNFIPNILFPVYDVAPLFGIAVCLVLYLFHRGINHIFNTFIKFWRSNSRFKKIFLPILFLFGFELLRYPLNPGYSIYKFILVPVFLATFLLFIIDLYFNYCNKSIDSFMNNYVKSYYYICNIIVITSAIVFVFFKKNNVGFFKLDHRNILCKKF